MLRIMRMDLPLLKTMTQAGGKLNKDLAKKDENVAKSYFTTHSGASTTISDCRPIRSGYLCTVKQKL